MKQQFASRDLDKVMVRMPDGMRDWIAQEARKNLRSANAQIVWMLRRMIQQSKATTEAGFADAAPVVSSSETAVQGGPEIQAVEMPR